MCSAISETNVPVGVYDDQRRRHSIQQRLKTIDPLLLFGACSLYGQHGVIEWRERSPWIGNLLQRHIRVSGPETIDKTLDSPISPGYAPRQIGNDDGSQASHHQGGCIKLRVRDELDEEYRQKAQQDGTDGDPEHELTCSGHSKVHV